MTVQDYRRSLARSHQARTRADRPSTFTLHGREWDLLPDVFAPVYSPSTRVAMELLGLPHRRTGSMLEMGSGTGVIAVSAALAGCEQVVAADINPAAVRNTAINAARHGVADRVRAMHSDLFAGLDPAERFDLIFWSSPYVLAPADYEFRTMHERAYVDPGYAAHRGFLVEAPRRLAPGGTVLLHFSTRGDLVHLLRLAGEHNRALRMTAHTVVQEGEHAVEHMLVEVLAQ